MTFGREFTDAVESKQVAQQEAERARYVVEKVIKLVVERPLNNAYIIGLINNNPSKAHLYRQRYAMIEQLRTIFEKVVTP